MKVVKAEAGVLVVELSRRNLQALLAKLDGHPPDSYCTLMKQGVMVKAVENEAHYSEYAPGELHEATADAITAAESQGAGA